MGAASNGFAAGAFADAVIVFDLDGTLVDSAPDLTRALNETLDLEGLPPVSVAKARKMVGQGARVLIERAAASSGVSFSPAHLDELTRSFIGFYRVDIASATAPYPGAPEALAKLANAGAKLAVCTNKRTDLSVQLLDALGLTARFSAIVGADATPNKKPHPDHYRAAVARAGGDVRRSVMIGDTVSDVGAAKAAGAPVILVRFGYGEDALETLGADAIAERFSEIPAMCARLLNSRASAFS